MVRKMFGIVSFVVVFLGIRAFNFYDDKKEVKSKLVEICATDGECKAAVDAHFDDCWSKSSSLTGPRLSMEVDANGLVQCLNGASGVEYFENQKP